MAQSRHCTGSSKPRDLAPRCSLHRPFGGTIRGLCEAMTFQEIQIRVTEAVTGIISLDALLAVVGHFGALPPRVRVVEVEPADESWGDGFSSVLASRLETIEEMIEGIVRELLR